MIRLTAWRASPRTRALNLRVLTGEFCLFREVPLFAPLVKHETDKLAGVSTVAHYKDRQNIVVQGDIGAMFFVLVSGSCEVKVDGTKVHTYKPTDFFGEIALFRSDTIRSATIVAVGPTTCIKFARKEFDFLLKVANVGKLLRDRVNVLLSDGVELTGEETYSVDMAQPGGTQPPPLPAWPFVAAMLQSL